MMREISRRIHKVKTAPAHGAVSPNGAVSGLSAVSAVSAATLGSEFHKEPNEKADPSLRSG